MLQMIYNRNNTRRMTKYALGDPYDNVVKQEQKCLFFGTKYISHQLHRPQRRLNTRATGAAGDVLVQKKRAT